MAQQGAVALSAHHKGKLNRETGTASSPHQVEQFSQIWRRIICNKHSNEYFVNYNAVKVLKDGLHFILLKVKVFLFLLKNANFFA